MEILTAHLSFEISMEVLDAKAKDIEMLIKTIEHQMGQACDARPEGGERTSQSAPKNTGYIS